MNAGMNMSNINNLLSLTAGKIPNNLTNNNVVNMDKGAFLNLMTQLINENQNQNPNMSNSALPELNIMDIISKNNSNIDLINMDNLNLDEAMLSEVDKEKFKTQTTSSLENFISMFNYSNFSNKIVNNEKEFELGNTIFTAEKTVPMNFKESQTTNKPMDDLGEQVKMENTLKMEKANTSSLSVQAEKLISEIENNKESFKKEIDYNIQLLSGKTTVQLDNKIITISDESSKLKPQIMAQVKDKITFMASEVPSLGNIKQVTMELQPHNLGKVDIKMTFEDDKITVEVKALNEETQKILSSNIEELSKALSKTTETSVKVLVKSESLFEQHITQYETNEQRFRDTYDQENNGQNRQRNYYFNQENEKDNDEESIFSELINLRNLKLQ